MHEGWSWPTFHFTVVETTVPDSPLPHAILSQFPLKFRHLSAGSMGFMEPHHPATCATNVGPIFGPERWSTSPQAHGTGCAHRRSCLGPDKKKTSGGWKKVIFSSCRLRLPRCPKPLQTPKYDQRGNGPSRPTSKIFRNPTV